MDFSKMIISEDATVLQAMKQLDEVAKKVLYLTKQDVLKGALSDGDLRRWLLSGGGLKDRISPIANYHPKYITEQQQEDAHSLLRKYGVESVPVVDKQGKILRIILWNEEEPIKKRKKLPFPVVMMAGGEGTRLYPYTRVLPKALIPIGETPIAELIMNRFHQFGCTEFYLVVNHKKNMIKAYFGETNPPYIVKYADEEEPLGTGGGLHLLKDQLKGTFILTNCDILIDADFSDVCELHQREGNAVTMICSLKNFPIPYGVVDIGESGEIHSMQEKPQISFFTNTGSYVVDASVLELIEEGEPIGFPDLIARCQAHGMKAGVYPINEGEWLDMGQPEEMRRMEEKLCGK